MPFRTIRAPTNWMSSNRHPLLREHFLGLGYAVQVMPVDFNLEKAIAGIRAINPYVVFNLTETLYNRSEFAFVAPSVLGYSEHSLHRLPCDTYVLCIQQSPD